MTKIDPSLYLRNNTQERVPTQELGKDEFLNLLMAQLANQDPLNPMEDTDFIAQMATFSSLEQLVNMTSSIDLLVQSQLVSPVIQYSHMIGKEVSYRGYDKETGKELDIETSSVVAVSQEDGWAVLELANGEKIFADSIIQITEQDSNNDEATEDEAGD